MDLSTQYATALLMTFSGAALGAVYDIYRTSLKEWRFLRAFSPWFDFGFWVFALVLVFTALLGANHGDVRLVVFVLLALGWFAYYKTAHPLVVAGTRFIVRLFLGLLRMVAGVFRIILVLPVLWAVRLLWASARRADCLLAMLEPRVVWPVELLGRFSRWIAQRARGWSLPFAKRILRAGKELARRASNTLPEPIRRLFAKSEGADDEENDSDSRG